MSRLSGQVCLVTGSSGGLGRSIALALAREGGDLVLAARNEERLKEVSGEITRLGQKAVAIPTDIASEDAVGRLFDRVKSEFGHIDLLVNNAGLATGGASHELSFETWRQVLSVNLDGAFLCSRSALAMMRPRRRGRIINIGSVSARVPRLHSAPYTTSKFALDGMTRAMALDAREYGVAVSVLHPGNTDTAIWDERREMAESEGLMDPDLLAQMVVGMACLPPEVNFLEGIVLPVSMPFLGRG